MTEKGGITAVRTIMPVVTVGRTELPALWRSG
jgi:hypothetical protein